MKDDQFQVLVKMIENIDTKIDNFRENVDEKFKQVDARFEQIDKRFEQIDKRFEQMDNRLDQMDENIRDVKQDVRDVKKDVIADRDKLQEVYESRDKVTVTFTRSWATASFFIALISSTIILAVAKAF